MAVTADWGQATIMAHEFAAVHPELVSALALYNDATFSHVGTGRRDTDGTTIPLPAGPVPVMELVSDIPAPRSFATMCGSNEVTRSGDMAHMMTIDDVYQFWAAVNKPTNVAYGPEGKNQKFCAAGFRRNGHGNVTILEKLVATGGNAEIAIYKMVGNARGTPFCSFNYNGVIDPTICASTNPPFDLRPSAGAACTWRNPCNHYVDTQSNYHLLGMLYNFMQKHKRT
jgi:hypothetical protein